MTEITVSTYLDAGNAYFARPDAVLPARPTWCPECGSADATYCDGDHTFDLTDRVLLIGCEGYWTVDPNMLGLDCPGWQPPHDSL